MDDNELCGGHHFSQNACMCEPDRFVSNLLHERSRDDRRFRAQCWEKVAFDKRRRKFSDVVSDNSFCSVVNPANTVEFTGFPVPTKV